jgi:hypothetical protein
MSLAAQALPPFAAAVVTLKVAVSFPLVPQTVSLQAL